MTAGRDAVIVGGGIVGLACAYELAKAGASVTLLEYGKTGMQATNAAAGMLAPIIESHGTGPMLDAGVAALRGYPALGAELEAACGFGIELRLDGILKVAFEGGDRSELRTRFEHQRSLGFDIEWLDAAMCRELEPRISERVAAGAFSPTEGGVSNQLLALALERAAIALGADIRQRTPVTGFKTTAGRVTAVRSGDQSFDCGAVVIAAGARSGQIAAKLSALRDDGGARLPTVLPVRPIRGQMIALGGMTTPIQHIVWGPRGYLVPRANGIVFAGATVEDVGFRRRTTVAGIRAMRSMASALVPQLASAKMHFDWAGLRPGSPDGLPMIGPLPPFDNVIAASGHFRNGILLGPQTGGWIARGITSGNWSHIPPVFSPSRFAA